MIDPGSFVAGLVAAGIVSTWVGGLPVLDERCVRRRLDDLQAE